MALVDFGALCLQRVRKDGIIQRGFCPEHQLFVNHCFISKLAF